MRIATDLYNPVPMLTFEGAAFTVLIGSGVIGYVFGFNPKWLGLAFAFLISFTGLTFLPKDPEGRSPWRLPLLIVAFLQGLIIFHLAVGFNTLHQGATPTHVIQAAVTLLDPVPWWPPAEYRLAVGEVTATMSNLSSRLLDYRLDYLPLETRKGLLESHAAVHRALAKLEGTLAEPEGMAFFKKTGDLPRAKIPAPAPRVE